MIRVLGVLILLVSFASPATAECTDYEVAVFSLVGEVRGFQHSQSFKEFGWSQAGPSKGWLDRMQALQTNENKPHSFQFFAKYGFGIVEVFQVADEYRTSGSLDSYYQGVENDINAVVPCN